MKVNLLSHKTDLLVSEFAGNITDKGDYLVIKTPLRPNFFWGNYIIFPEEPGDGDYQKWTDIYKYEFDNNPGFMALTWDTSNEGLTEEFIKNGFKLSKCEVLRAEEFVKPQKYNNNVEIRELISENDWDQFVEVHTDDSWQFSPDTLSGFLEQLRDSAKKIVESGKGKRFGAFLDGKLIGEAGIYYDGNIGRYNEVATHPDHRRQGVCGTLIYNTARIATESMGLKTLVMVAADSYRAAKIYKTVGFKVCEEQIELEWYDEKGY